MPRYDHEYPPLWVLMDWAAEEAKPARPPPHSCWTRVRELEEPEQDYYFQKQWNDTATPASSVEENTGPTERAVQRVDRYTTEFLPRAHDLNYPFKFSFVFKGPSYRLYVWDRPYRPRGTATKPITRSREVQDTYTVPTVAATKRTPVFFGN
ncbi:hypothetical protein CYLTODRAFT_458506 [Cylindrobasidium torrendii FP15055 ss-10]|uniref:Uncharacterized protein n=1 Tax=Cylindrobasidium torrendii FP15055 ss-10 TaxID=1314674 RepID=A0A0D7AXN5_9AGAR|nr:hypothetical protein CYLTODRAFT_459302 [Cylindrobasidium torrendii FP15055 ss-10]KIY62987.1 hypothetical protein CYLTODRAFT_458506 [Cylindrobasidium torrendii FP15055 ss-10]